jgi:predicted phage terminase large subunit-like protein
VTNGCEFWLLDVWRDRVDYPTLKAKVVELATQWGARQVLVEEAGTALGLLDELKSCVRGLTGIKPERDKVTRMSIASAAFEAAQVHLPERAPWLAELEAELFSFPGSRHDDQVDSISQAIYHGKAASLWTYFKIAERFSSVASRPYLWPSTEVFGIPRW